MANLFYKPHDAWAADFIPFYHAGIYHLFYLQDWRNSTQHGEGTPWYQVSTRDFVSFTEHGEMLPRGTHEEQDLYVFTGSVAEGPGRYHIFYTGHNPCFRKADRPEQGVMHAVSDDLLNWRKLPEETFYAPPEDYEMHDWRDPYIFWNDQAGEYWMLLAARRKDGPSRRRGCTALCSSTDLQHWQVREPFYSPGLYYTHECPDLFRIGEWWYLVFSEFSERLVTRYRMARSIHGPWLTPDDDQFDGRAFYAAKTAGDGQKRYLFGWNPTREGETDHGSWQWGGNLVVHELVQQADGTLGVRLPESVNRAFGVLKPARLLPAIGSCHEDGHGVRLDAQGTFACASGGEMPERCKISVTLAFDGNPRAGGIMLHAGDDWEQAYYIRIEPTHNRLVFDMWPRPGDKPYMPELERPLRVTAGSPIRLTVLVDGTLCETYVNDRIAMSTRCYDLQRGQWGVFAEDACVTCTDIGWS
ncbi:MAG: GH32 C-terminal domain-containing protein [Chloroflexi bacterium]|nr:GH32 C-terminal domain-containing protein [Chloroflexota bacterium]